MLQGAMDLSGTGVETEQFMGIVIGTETSMCGIIQDLKCDPDKPDKTTRARLKLCSKLKFNKKDNIAFCVKINRNKIMHKIKEKKNKKNMETEKIFRSYNRIIYRLIRDKLETFSIKHKTTLSAIAFQCDADCIDFLKDTGLCHTCKGDVHVLSDLVAWINNRGKNEPQGIIVMDITNHIENKLKKILK